METTEGTLQLPRGAQGRARALALAVAFTATLAVSFSAGRMTASQPAGRVATHTATVKAPELDAATYPAHGPHHRGVVKQG
jgi:hypothetical protein